MVAALCMLVASTSSEVEMLIMTIVGMLGAGQQRLGMSTPQLFYWLSMDDSRYWLDIV